MSNHSLYKDVQFLTYPIIPYSWCTILEYAQIIPIRRRKFMFCVDSFARRTYIRVLSPRIKPSLAYRSIFQRAYHWFSVGWQRLVIWVVSSRKSCTAVSHTVQLNFENFQFHLLIKLSISLHRLHANVFSPLEDSNAGFLFLESLSHNAIRTLCFILCMRFLVT